MKVDTNVILSALKFLTGDTEHVCRLCFSSTENEKISIEDSKKLNKYYFNESVTYIQMLQELEVNLDAELPQMLCTKCATMTINSYLFRKFCQHADQKWIEVFREFNTALDKSNTLGPNVKTAYLLINENDSVMFTSKKTHTFKSKKNALIKIKDIMKSRQSYVKIKKGNSNIICEECGQRFQMKCHLMKHMRNHSKTCFMCSHCPKMFASQMQLDKHSERVHRPKRIQCPKCFKMFSTPQILKYHEKLYHVAALCKICLVQFPSKKDLRAHLDKHYINKCETCNKEFLNKHTYKLHLKICGTTDRHPSFFCDICNKGYIRKNGLRTHLKTDHGFGNVLSCKWCDKKFDAISRLRNHIVKHTKERNYYCDQCGNKFVTQAALVYHVRLHTGEKPFKCDMCDEAFLSASRRMEHKRRKHLGPTKECHICHVKFITGHQLRRHVERHYNPQSKLYVPKDFLADDLSILKGQECINVQNNLLSI